jgi:hypothetical protein
MAQPQDTVGVYNQSQVPLTFNLASITFPYIQPSTSVHLLDAWIDESTAWIALQHPGSDRIEDFSVVSAFALDGQRYLIIRPLNGFCEDPDCRYVLVAVQANGKIETLTYDRFQPLQESVPPLCQATALAEFAAMFDLPTDEESKVIAGALRGDLTNIMYVANIETKPGRHLTIARRWRLANGDVYLALTEPSGETGDFQLNYFVTADNNQYLVVAYPPEVTEGDEMVPRIPLRIKGENMLTTLEMGELRRIKKAVVQLAVKQDESNLDSVETIIGSIPRP